MNLFIQFLIIFSIGSVFGGALTYHFISWIVDKGIKDGKIELILKDK